MDQPAVVPRKRRRRLHLWIPIVLLIALVTWQWVGQAPLVVDEPVCLQRDESGQWHATQGEWEPSTSGILVNIGAEKTNRSFATAIRASSSDDSRFTYRHLMIIDRSNDVLTRCVSAHLLDHLAQIPDVRRIEYYPPAHQPPDGNRAPDIIIALALEADSKTRRLPFHSVRDITLDVVATPAPVVSRHGYRDHLTPPLVHFKWTAKLNCQIRYKGVSNWAGRTQAIAQDLAKSIATNLGKTFTKLHDKHGQLPELPPVFYPPYRAPPRLACLDRYGATRISTMCGLMMHNQTFWAFHTDRNPRDVFAEFQRNAEVEGWSLSDKDPDPEFPSMLRMQQASSLLELFRTVDRGSNVTDMGVVPVPAPPVYYIRYVERFTARERLQAIDEWFSDDVPVETLLLLRGSFSAQHRDWILHRLAESASTDCHTWLTMAELYHENKQTEAARHALLRARMWRAASGKLGSAASKIRYLAKTLGDESLAHAPIDLHALEEAGFVRVNPLTPIAPRDIESGHPVVYYAVTDGKIRTLCFRLHRSNLRDNVEHVSVECIKRLDLAGGSGSPSHWSEYTSQFTGTTETWRIDDTHSATFIVNRRSDADGYRIIADWDDTSPTRHAARAARSVLPHN